MLAKQHPFSSRAGTAPVPSKMAKRRIRAVALIVIHLEIVDKNEVADTEQFDRGVIDRLRSHI